MSYADRATKFLAERRERLGLRDVLASTVPLTPTRPENPDRTGAAPTEPPCAHPVPRPPDAQQTSADEQTAPRDEKNEGNEESPSRGWSPVAYELLTTPDEVAAALPALRAAETLGFDLETAGAADRAEALDPRLGRIRLMQFAAGKRVCLVDCDRVAPSTLAPLFADGPTLVGHNLKFDLRFLLAAGLPVPAGDRLVDTMLASQLLHAGTDASHSLQAVVDRELGRALDKTVQASDWSGALSEEQLAYAAADAAVLPPLAERLRVRLARDGLTRAMELELRALPAVAWLEFAGAPLDAARWGDLAEQAAAQQEAHARQIEALVPGLNPNSTPQLKAHLAEAGVTVPDVKEETLRRAVERHPLIPPVLAYREATKRASTYGAAFLEHVHPVTGRIHADYRQIGAATGRMACSNPNLQNIPRDPAYRACVRPPAGRVLIKADFSQIELRVAAQLSGDAAMRDAFRAGEDLHAATARAVLGREPTTEDRRLAKACNFGLVYGMGSDRLRAYAQSDYGVEMTAQEARRFRDRFFAAYPGLCRWHRRQKDGRVATRTLTGRRRLEVERFTEKLNSPVQGAGADVLKLALARLWEDRAAAPSAVPVLAVHDEVVLEVDAAEAERAAEWLRGHMEAAGNAVLPDVPVAVEAAVVRDWSGTDVGPGG